MPGSDDLYADFTYFILEKCFFTEVSTGKYTEIKPHENFSHTNANNK
jgi:hypothetical protein